ncbi:MAG: sulfotransferase [Pseudomonadota bacterium]
MIFIVGNSRSGTTMLGRIFGLNSRVHTFGELHFFEQMIDTNAILADPEWSRPKLIKLAERLITSSREGLFFEVVAGRYTAEAQKLVDGLDSASPVALYAAILFAHTHEKGREIPLEQTPRYLFSVAEILERFPQAHAINIIRDPRDVMQSQKNRWKRGRFSESGVPLLWTIRSWANYHPFTTSKLWNASKRMADKLADHPRFHSIQYEALLSDPEAVLRGLCKAIGLPFEEGMLQVTQVGSSTGQDRPDRRGLDKSRIGSWQRGDLSKAEIAICEEVAGEHMAACGYTPSGVTASVVSKFALKVSFPVKLAFAGLVNLNRFRNLPHLLARRLAR